MKINYAVIFLLLLNSASLSALDLETYDKWLEPSIGGSSIGAALGVKGTLAQEQHRLSVGGNISFDSANTEMAELDISYGQRLVGNSYQLSLDVGVGFVNVSTSPYGSENGNKLYIDNEYEYSGIALPIDITLFFGSGRVRYGLNFHSVITPAQDIYMMKVIIPFGFFN